MDMRHPSLDQPFVRPPPLKPQRFMGPSAPCWCGSGQPHVKCHFMREQRKRLAPHEIDEMAQEFARKGYCSYPKLPGELCDTTITDAHTVQKRGSLTAIAEHGHVLDPKPQGLKAMTEHSGRTPPRLIGIGQASTFPGFCNKHDAVFRPIEGKQARFDCETALLFAYRAFAYERYKKELQQQHLTIMREQDRGAPFEKQVGVQQIVHLHGLGIRRGLAEVDALKADLEQRLQTRSFEGMHFHAVTFDDVLPVAACGAFQPEFAFDGTPLQRLARGDAPLEHVTLSLVVYEGKSSVIFAWLGNPLGPATRFVQSFAAIPDDRKADAVLRVTLENLENVYMNPSWWNGLPKDAQAVLMDHFWSGLPGNRTAQRLLDTGGTWVTARVDSNTSVWPRAPEP